jgi:hypothetical protein
MKLQRAAFSLALVALGCSDASTALPIAADAGAADAAGGGAGGLATGGTSGTGGPGLGGAGGSSSGGAGGSSLGGAGGSSSGGQAGTASDAGSGGSTASGCAPGDCPGGTCWQRLDGGKECVDARADVPREMCQSFDQMCCTSDTACTAHAGGHCVSRLASALSCGGARPFGNACSYDACVTDADCMPGLPAGATVAACIPAGALGLHAASCRYGGCRTDADCTLHPGGTCELGLAATHNGMCDLRQVLFCAYPTDPCQARYGSCPQNAGPLVCAPEESYQGRHCVPAPPAYP